jgi:hypothetical protein
LFRSCSYQRPHSELWRHSRSLMGTTTISGFDREEPRHLTMQQWCDRADTTNHKDVHHKEVTVNRHKYDSFEITVRALMYGDISCLTSHSLRAEAGIITKKGKLSATQSD